MSGHPDDSDYALRLSDAERNHALMEISTHYVDGRIDEDEFNRRSEGVMTARIRGDLVELFADLPGGVPISSTSGTDLVPAPAAAVAPATDPDLAYLAEVERKAKLVNRVDAIIPTVALVLFFVLGYTVGFGISWIVWPASAVMFVIARTIAGLGEDEEKLYQEIEKKEAAARKERIETALKKRRELESGEH